MCNKTYFINDDSGELKSVYLKKFQKMFKSRPSEISGLTLNENNEVVDIGSSAVNATIFIIRILLK